MLSGKLASTNVVTTIDEMHIGTHYFLNLNFGHYKLNFWVLDSGATWRICNNKQLFFDLKHITNTRVLLPNQSRMSVHLMGNIKLSDALFLKDVLFVPKFELNLISITSLTSAKTISMKFYHDCASIKHI